MAVTPMADRPSLPVRLRARSDVRRRRPVHVVWEITLACNLRCVHCGSRAGRPRQNELSTAECLQMVDALAGLGTREITLIGGEAYLRRDWLEIVRSIAGHDILCGLQTGGRALTEEKIRDAAAAGLRSAGVSIDGPAELHDRLRGVRGSHTQAMAALRNFRKYGLSGSVNTQITSAVLPHLDEVMDSIIEAGARVWQIQLTVAMGNAADNAELLLQPYDIVALMPKLASLHERGKARGLRLVPGNNIGYFGPYEAQWRSVTERATHWQACSAGETAMGIEADGTIKGCPSLATGVYGGGSVRDRPLAEIWNESKAIRQTVGRTVTDLWGLCQTCYYAPVCKAGCTWTTHSLFGKPGNNPYCHYRALHLDRLGLRERIVKVQEAPGLPFDNGRFDLILERTDGTAVPAELERSIRLGPASANKVRSAKKLQLCHHCNEFSYTSERRCPHCGTGKKTARKVFIRRESQNARLVKKMQALLQKIEALNAAAGDGV
jgi:radical SAM protein with 4Fe4S-binding SPASM domain